MCSSDLAGDQVRITAQLIEAEGGFHLWSESYDRKLDNIFAVQDEIANAIVDALWRAYKVRHIDMPATPERVWQAIEEGQQLHRM